MKSTSRLALGILTIVLIASGAGATTMIRLDSAAMASEAEAIVIGSCTSASSEWVDGALMTLITVEIDESLKGDESGELTLVIPGGIDADRAIPVAVTYPGAPVVFEGENVLLFLTTSNAVAGGYDVVGFSQGKFTLVEDASGQQSVAQGQSGDASSMSLAEMKRQIAEVLAAEE